MNQYTVPAFYDVETGDLLYQWLGSFWSGICEDSEMLYNMYKANGVLSAQLYQEFTDSINLTNRNKVPLYHRKMWFPVVIYLTDQNAKDACGIKLNMSPTPVIGPQTDPHFEVGNLFTIGGPAPYKDVTAYKLASNINSIAAISDNIATPKVVYLHGANYVVQNSTLYFLNGQDPFSNPAFKSEDVEVDGQTTKKITLWCAETLLDRNYVYNYVGYVLGLQDATSPEYLSASNALWDVYNSGASMELFNVALAAILGEPVIINPVEIVDTVVNIGGVKQVITNLSVYTINTNGTIRSDIVPGMELRRGTFLTTAIKVYDNLDPARLQADSPDVQTFREDVPALFLPAPFFRATLDHGIGVSWELSDIINAGVDGNGNTKYRFKLYGYPEDIERVWTDAWGYCEANNIPFGTVLTGYLHETSSQVVGAISGKITPLEFFMSNFLKANALIVVVDTDRLSAFGLNNFHNVAQLHKVIPAHVYMFVIEKTTRLRDNYNLGTTSESSVVQSVANAIRLSARPGMPSTRTMTYRDCVTRLQWVPTCPR